MNKTSGFIFIIFLFGFCVSGGYAQNAPEDSAPLDSTPVISMDFKDVSLKDILKVFSIQSGINFIASQEIEDRTVTLYLDRVSVREAMDNLFKANKLDYEFCEEAKIILVKKAEPEIETITKVFLLRYASVSTSSIQEERSSFMSSEEKGEGGGGESSGKWAAEEKAGITYVIKELLSDVGKLIEEPRTNSLIITDLPNRFPIIEKTIQELDVPIPQIMLEVEMLDVSKNLVDKLGFNFGDTPLTWVLPGGLREANFYIGAASDRGKEGAITFGSTYASVLDSLRTQSDTKYLARPRILTLNNETAEIKIETNELLGLFPQWDEGKLTGYQTERELTGISLRVTPQVNLITGEITMFICPKVVEASLSSIQPTILMAGQTPYKDTEERATKSLVKVRDGETIIMGGLIRKTKYETRKKIPILGDVPIIGVLFRHKNKEKDLERELLVFITPHIVRDVSMSLAEDNNVILSSREQDIAF